MARGPRELAVSARLTGIAIVARAVQAREAWRWLPASRIRL
jgi:hypothetical protein